MLAAEWQAGLWPKGRWRRRDPRALAALLMVVFSLLGGVLSPQGFAADSATDVPRPEAVRRCKNATALLSVGASSSGAAVCIDARGYFVTNRHLLDSFRPGNSVRLVLRPGEETEKVVIARVLHLADDGDLALLDVAGQHDLTAIELGDDAPLEETSLVIALGYIPGKPGPASDSAYPNVTVHTGRITSLRKQKGRLMGIGLDALATPASSGGPVIDATGRIVGIVVGAGGAGWAVPVSRLKEFLAQPALLVELPTLNYASRVQPARFSIEAIELHPEAAPLAVELELPGEGAMRRTIEAKLDGQRYVATAVPTAQSSQSLKLHVKARFDESVSGVVKDRPVQIGSTMLRLAEIRQVERLLDVTIVSTIYGTKLAVQTVDLGPLTPAGAAKPRNLNEARLVDVFVYDLGPLEIPFQVHARRGQSEVASLAGAIPVAGHPAAAPPQMRGLVAYWRFEEGELGEAVRIYPLPQILADASGNGNDLRAWSAGTAPRFSAQVPATLVTATGAANRRSLDFSDEPDPKEANRYLSVVHHGAGIDLREHPFVQWTIEASVLQTDNQSPFQTFVCHDGDHIPHSEGNYTNFNLEKHGSVFWVVATAANGRRLVLEGKIQVQLGHWHHVAAVSDGKTVKLFVDAGDGQGYRLDGTGELPGPLYASDRDWVIGRGMWGGHPQSRWHGLIDEVRICDVALDPSEFLFAPQAAVKNAAAIPDTKTAAR